jgi:hypothetical protein
VPYTPYTLSDPPAPARLATIPPRARWSVNTRHSIRCKRRPSIDGREDDVRVLIVETRRVYISRKLLLDFSEDAFKSVLLRARDDRDKGKAGDRVVEPLTEVVPRAFHAASLAQEVTLRSGSPSTELRASGAFVICVQPLFRAAFSLPVPPPPAPAPPQSPDRIRSDPIHLPSTRSGDEKNPLPWENAVEYLSRTPSFRNHVFKTSRPRPATAGMPGSVARWPLARSR